MFKFDWNAFLLANYRASCSLDASAGVASYEHGIRVAIMCRAVALALGFSQEQRVSLVTCALLHDIVNPPQYKIIGETIPNQEDLREHCLEGQDMLDRLPLPSPVDGFVTYHHELQDGLGPFGKKAGEIPFEASLIGLCGDLEMTVNFDGLSPVGLPLLRDSMETDAFKQFDPLAVRTLAKVLDGKLLHLLRSDILYAFWLDLPRYYAACDEIQTYRLGSYIAKLVGAQSEYTHLHSSQVANIIWHVGNMRGYDDATLALLFATASVHDCGKLSISGRLLDKKSKLTPVEMEIVQTHAALTLTVTRSVEGLEEAGAWAGNHHERLDGSGYPNGLTARELDEPSQLLAVCDVYEAVGARRPYHPRRSPKQIEYVMEGMAQSGKLNAQMVAQVCSLLQRYNPGEVPAPWQLQAV
jgi:HD-GYP domain-containing protein (c-di-GMP phosphodiesterase class II)